MFILYMYKLYIQCICTATCTVPTVPLQVSVTVSQSDPASPQGAHHTAHTHARLTDHLRAVAVESGHVQDQTTG